MLLTTVLIFTSTNVVGTEPKPPYVSRAPAVVTLPEPLSLQDIGDMAMSGFTDTIIINQVRATNSVYRLSANDIRYLKACGISDRVITEMQATFTR